MFVLTMDGFLSWIAAIAVIIVSLDRADSLSCYECANVKLSGNQGIIGDLMKDDIQNEPACDAASLTGLASLDVKECSYGEMCGTIKGSVKFSLPLLGSVTHSTVIRSCMPSTSTGCVPGTHDAAGVLSMFLDGATSLDGEICYCDTDLCSAGTCPDSYVKLADYCLEWWMALLAAVGGVLLLLLCTCCCCCCCRCCRSKKPNGGLVILQSGPPPPNQFQNVLYDVHVPVEHAEQDSRTSAGYDQK